MQQTFTAWPTTEAMLSAPRCAPAGATARTMFHLMSELTRESAHFVGLRMERYADLQMSLARCTTPMAGYERMMDFYKQTLEDYAHEAERAPALLGRIHEEALVDLEAQLDPAKAPAVD